MIAYYGYLFFIRLQCDMIWNYTNKFNCCVYLLVLIANGITNRGWLLAMGIYLLYVCNVTWYETTSVHTFTFISNWSKWATSFVITCLGTGITLSMWRVAGLINDWQYAYILPGLISFSPLSCIFGKRQISICIIHNFFTLTYVIG